MILAIDTSTAQASVALWADGPRAELSWVAGANHSTQLLDAIRSVMSLGTVGKAELTALAVARGPGSFSGLRVGLSAGKALAMALSIPLAAISTLDVIAAAAPPNAARLWAVLPAGRGQLYAAEYAAGPESLVAAGEPHISTPADIARLLHDGDHLAGEGAAMLAEAAPRNLDLITGSRASRLRRASYLAELGEAYFSRGGRDQAADAEPLYLRRSAAEEKRDGA